jgi:nucleoside-diphosphate-sugar epimerase
MAASIFARYGIYGDISVLDLRDRDPLRKWFHEVRPSITFNLAGYGVDRSERDEQEAYLINAQLVQAISEVISEVRDLEWPGQDVVHVGSALEYGLARGNLSEDSIAKPTTLYGKSKLAGTVLLEQCCKTFQIKGVTARLFTVFGPGEHSGRLMPSLIDTARTGKPLALSAGNQRRDFTYVEDVAEGLLRLATASTPGPGEVVNLATGKLTPVRRFVEIAAEILRIPGERLNFGAISTREEEMEHDNVSVKRLRQLLAWVPPTSIEEGIQKTSAWEDFRSAPAIRTRNESP